MAETHVRRDLLKLGAAAIAAGAVANMAAAADPAPASKPRRPLKKAYFGLPKGGSLVERFKILKEAGFDGLQLNMPDKGLPVEQVAEALKESGLKMEGTCDSQHWRLHLSS